MLSLLSIKVTVAQSCLTLCNPMNYTVHGILQTRILEWVAFPFSMAQTLSEIWMSSTRLTPQGPGLYLPHFLFLVQFSFRSYMVYFLIWKLISGQEEICLCRGQICVFSPHGCNSTIAQIDSSSGLFPFSMVLRLQGWPGAGGFI